VSVDAPTPVDGTSAAQAPDGRTVGRRYTLRSSVGSGGMGTVWRAFDELLRREVAVKEVLLPPGIPAPERSVLCERTLREARAAAALNHPAVIRVYDVVNDGDRPWIVMELLDAASLADTLRDEGPLPYDRVAEIGLAVLGALEAAHRVGVLHRDVKPGNVLLGNDARVTLTDFGVARSPNESPLTSTGLLLGSPQYIAPERARGRPFGPPSDLFSLGATLYTAVEGRPPFDRGDPLPTMTAVVVEPPDQMAFAGPMAPVLLGLLEKDPQQRWDTEKTRNALRTVLGGGRITSLDGRAPRQSRSAGQRGRREEPSPNPADPAARLTPSAGSTSALPNTPASAGAHARPGATEPPVPSESPESSAPAQRPAPEGTAAMAVNPFTTEGLPSIPPDESGSPSTPGAPPESSQARGGRHAGSASVRGSVPVSGQPPAPGQPPQAGGAGTPFSGYARVPGVGPGTPPSPPPNSYNGYSGYGEPNYGDPANATAPLPSSAPSSAPRRSAYLDSRSGNVGGHTMVAPQPTISGPQGRRKTVLTVVAVFVVVLLIGVISYLISVATSGDSNGATQSPGSTQSASNVALTAYKFPRRGFNLKAPTAWKKTEYQNYVDFNSLKDINSQQDLKIRALVEDGESPESQIRAAERVQKGYLNAGKISAYEPIVKQESTEKLSGQDTWEWQYTYTKSNVERRVLWRVAVVDGSAYSLFLSAPKAQYDNLVATYNQVSESFTLTNT
jgi:serine/threonine protein kinase